MTNSKAPDNMFAADIAKRLGSREFERASDILRSNECLHDWRAFQSYQGLTCIARRRWENCCVAGLQNLFQRRTTIGKNWPCAMSLRSMLSHAYSALTEILFVLPVLMSVGMLDLCICMTTPAYAEHLAMSFCLFSPAILWFPWSSFAKCFLCQVLSMLEE